MSAPTLLRRLLGRLKLKYWNCKTPQDVAAIFDTLSKEDQGLLLASSLGRRPAPAPFSAIDRAFGTIRLAILDAQKVLEREGHHQAAERLEDMVPILTEVGVEVKRLQASK